MGKLNLMTYVVNKDKDEIVNMLYEMSDFDLDFNGEKGEDYLWESLEGTEFESNRDYALHIALKEKSLKNTIETFIKMWLENESYYDEHILTIEEQDNKYFVAFAFVIEH